MDLELYRVFAAIAKASSISGAARSLFISQPAVSQALSQLEGELGVRLFDRNSRGVAITPEGEALLPYVTTALSQLASGEERLRQLKQFEGGVVRIGASDTVCSSYLLDIFERFSALYPEVTLRVTNRTSQGTLSLLRSGQVDVGFINLPLAAPDMEVTPCLTVHDCFVAGQRFFSLAGQPLTPEALSRLPLLMLEEASVSRRSVDKHFARLGVTLRPQIELSSLDLLAQFARIGLGVACVIREFVHLSEGALIELPVHPAPPPRSVARVCLKGKAHSQAVRSFLTLF